MQRNSLFAGLLIIGMMIFSCTSSDEKKTTDKSGAEDTTAGLSAMDFTGLNDSLIEWDSIPEDLPIFYNMYLEVELTSLFESAEAIYTPELMNLDSKASSYLTSSKQAVNLGIYAVDLSYAKVFDQVQDAAGYFNAMRELIEEMDIPLELFESTLERFEQYRNDKEALIALANEVYVTADNYLNENKRETSAALVIMGGWIEAMHIALFVAEQSRDAEIIERLIYQRNSLNNLILLLETYKDKKAVPEYLNELHSIKKTFDAVDVVFDENFDSKSPAEKENIIGDALKKLVTFRDKVTAFRDKLIS